MAVIHGLLQVAIHVLALTGLNCANLRGVVVQWMKVRCSLSAG